MRAGVAGLGSMGRRRVRDLLALGHRVIGFDLRPERSAAVGRDFEIPIASSPQELLDGDIDALIVCTPPDRHVEYYERALSTGMPFFSEANILTPAPAWFEARAAGLPTFGYPSATWRFHPLVALLRERIAALPADGLRSIHHHYGGYLPRWHPTEPYDEFYAGANRATSAAREMVPFELDWICWLLGPVAAVAAINRARGEWSTDIDDTYALLLEFESGAVGTLVIELHQLAPIRTARLSHREESFTLDLDDGRLIHHRRDSHGQLIGKAIGSAGIDIEQVYLREIQTFAEAVTGGQPYPKSWREDRHLSDVLYAAELSERSSARVWVGDAQNAYAGTDLSDVSAISARAQDRGVRAGERRPGPERSDPEGGLACEV